MKEVFLSQLCGYWYFFETDVVERVLAVADTSAPIQKTGRIWIPLPAGEPAELCPLHLIFSWASQQKERSDHFLVLAHADRLLALPMRGEGRLCMANMDALQALPPAFSGLCRQAIPALLVNGEEVLMQINLDEMVQATDKVAYLRKRKLLSQRQAAGQKEKIHAD